MIKHIYLNINDQTQDWKNNFFYALDTLRSLTKENKNFYPILPENLSSPGQIRDHFFLLPSDEALLSESKWAYLISYITVLSVDFKGDIINTTSYRKFDRTWTSWAVAHKLATEVWIFDNGSVRCK